MEGDYIGKKNSIYKNSLNISEITGIFIVVNIFSLKTSTDMKGIIMIQNLHFFFKKKT